MLKQLINEFLQNCRRKELSEHTIRAYELDLKNFNQYCNRNSLDLQTLEARQITGWIDQLQLLGLSATSRKRHLACLKVFYKWLEEGEHISNSPMPNLKLIIKLPKRLPRNINQTDLLKLFRALEMIDTSQGVARQTLRLALEILITTGVRISELCNIQVQDIDFTANAIRVSGKGARERNAFVLDEDVQKLLKSYLQLRQKEKVTVPHLFITPSGHKATPDYIRRLLHKFTDEVGIQQKLTPHMFRHSAATLLLENGVDIRFVQRLLGHASLSTTEIYTHVTENSLKAALTEGDVRKKLKSA